MDTMHLLKEKVLTRIVLLLPTVCLFAAENLNVKIIDRQNHEAVYTYSVPGYSTSNSIADVNCYGSTSNINCSGATRATTSSTPTRVGSYEVKGATFSLQLPTGRVVVVNCESKLPPVALGVALALASGGASANRRRSCRMPIVNDIHAEFSGDNAKLKWPVSIDGKKLESETYKILAVLDKP
jgi:hypothetical protein